VFPPPSYVGGQGTASANRDVLLAAHSPNQVALLQLMGTPELTGQEDSLQMHQLKMK